MHKTIRRLIYLAFFAVFFTVVPVLILYATGYRYNVKKNILEKTGILVVDSVPKKADVFVNNGMNKKTPARFGRLLPDSYDITVHKDGYYDWRNTIKVNSGLTTFLNEIILFRQALPALAIGGKINILAITPDQQKILYSLALDDTTEELRILNLSTKTDVRLETLNPKLYDRLEFVAWSPNQSRALLNQLIGDFNSYRIVNLDTLTTRELFDITRLNFNQLAWDQANDITLYGITQTSLQKIDLSTNATQTMLTIPMADFQIRGNDIYYITQNGAESFLNHGLRKHPQAEPEKIKLASPSNFRLKPAGPQHLALLDQLNQDLFVITTTAFNDSRLEDDIVLSAKAKDIYWSKNFNQLIYFTDFELWTYDFSAADPILVNRFGQQIKNALWYPGNKYIIYQTPDAIHVTETSSLGTKNDLELAKLQALDNMVLDRDGVNLYFKGVIGNQAGMYQLTLQ